MRKLMHFRGKHGIALSDTKTITWRKNDSLMMEVWAFLGQ